MTRHEFTRIAHALIACGALASTGSSGAAAQSRRAYRSGVELVPLTVTVTNRAGEYVKGLTGSDFTVLEDGVPQPLAFFAAGTVPIVSLALVLDTSASMARTMPLVRAAGQGPDPDPAPGRPRGGADRQRIGRDATGPYRQRRRPLGGHRCAAGRWQDGLVARRAVRCVEKSWPASGASMPR